MSLAHQIKMTDSTSELSHTVGNHQSQAGHMDPSYHTSFLKKSFLGGSSSFSF